MDIPMAAPMAPMDPYVAQTIMEPSYVPQATPMAPTMVPTMAMQYPSVGPVNADVVPSVNQYSMVTSGTGMPMVAYTGAHTASPMCGGYYTSGAERVIKE
eukprot:198169_1